MQQKRPGRSYVAPIKSDGTIPVDESGLGIYTLLANTTYFYPLGGDAATFMSTHLEGDTSIILTSAVIEDSNLSPVKTDANSQDPSDFSVAGLGAVGAGDWVALNPATGVWDCFAVGTGWTMTASTLATGGGNAGGGIWVRPRCGSLRSRLKVVVGATGGLVRVATHGKS